METCLFCGRQIRRMRKGCGGFRRHMKSKGVVCDGSWRTPSRQREVIEQQRLTKRALDELRAGRNLTVILIPPQFASNANRYPS
jgi:hypothetical protein